MHVARYRHALPFTKGRRVLDIACGTDVHYERLTGPVEFLILDEAYARVVVEPLGAGSLFAAIRPAVEAEHETPTMSFLRESADLERRSSRWDQRAGVGNYLTLCLGHLSSALLAVTALWLASRAIGTSGYGGIVAVIAASQFLGQFAIQWTAIAVFRHGCEEFVETGSIAASFWNRLAILSLNLALVLGSTPLWLPSLSRWLELPAGAHWLLLAHLTDRDAIRTAISEAARFSLVGGEPSPGVSE